MKMKFPLLFSLLLAPQLVFAQPGLTNKQKTARIANLIDNSAFGYLKVKSFSGTIDLSFTEKQGGVMKPVFESRLQTVYQLDNAGNKIREVSLFSLRHNSAVKLTSRTTKVVDDGKTQTQIAVEPQIYARTQRYNEVAPFAFLAPTLKRIARALRQEDSAVSSISSLSTTERILGVSSKGSKTFDSLKAVIDEDTGTIRALSFSLKDRGFIVRTSQQIFNPRLSESQFKWTPPKTFKQVEEKQMPALMEGLVTKPKPKTAPIFQGKSNAETGCVSLVSGISI